ncbi:MAG: hypothetical protein JO056_09585 [Alphaproteobacteria bacterium]|nr:hypothetical protein [Alphaproteobacteria bacterium]
MRNFARQLISMIAFIGCAGPAAAGTLIPVVPFPDSSGTTAYDINDKNEIAGFYVADNGFYHAFFGTLDGQYTSFDGENYQGFAKAIGINNDGWITGYYLNGDICPPAGQCEFVRKPDGTFVTLSKHGTPLSGLVGQISSKARFVGSYYDLDRHNHSFVGQKTKYKKDLRSDMPSPRARGINSHGTIVGYSPGTDHDSGFVLQHGVSTLVDYPDDTASNTYLYKINKSGIAVGYWDTGAPDYIVHGFSYDTKTSTFYPLDVPGALLYTYLQGINAAGFIAVQSDAGDFIYCPHKPAKCPGGGMAVSFGPGIHVPAQKLARHHPGHGVRHRTATGANSPTADRVDYFLPLNLSR